MRPTTIINPTHKYEAPANWDAEKHGECGALFVRASDDNGLVELFSCWKPNATELLHLNSGGVVQVGLCTALQCAMSVGVVDPVPEGIADYYEASDRPAAITINEEAHGD